jgi:fructose-bisphosphate aldolase/6-deoxy-5-ketofructose 1-phosphate synthase
MDNSHDFIIPLDVPADKRDLYRENYSKATHGSGRLMIFAGDQKVEHLNADFYGADIPKENNDPEHLFKIASKAKIGLFAAQLELIARYGGSYPNIPYLLKLNSKTNLVKTEEKDPVSYQWYTSDEIKRFIQESKLPILAVGYTLYLGSEFESEMLKEAAELVFLAHQLGLLAVLWMYPRGKAVEHERDPHIIAGATGVSAALGADFVKINPPKTDTNTSPELLKEAVGSAGRTKVICAGGESMNAQDFLHTLYEQIHIGGTMGSATGRNIHQKPLEDAVRFANAIFALTVENKSVEESMNVYTHR